MTVAGEREALSFGRDDGSGMPFGAGEAGANDFLLVGGIECVSFLVLVEQAQGLGGDMFLGKAVAREHFVSWSGCAEGVDPDTATVGTGVANGEPKASNCGVIGLPNWSNCWVGGVIGLPNWSSCWVGGVIGLPNWSNC